MKTSLILAVLLGSALAGAQTLKQKVDRAYRYSERIRNLENEKVAIEQLIFETKYDLGKLMTVREVLESAQATTLPKGCKVQFDGKTLTMINDTRETVSWSVYNSEAAADVAGFGVSKYVSAKIDLDLNSYEKRTVVVRYGLEGNIIGLYAEQYYEDHGRSTEWIARCWPL